MKILLICGMQYEQKISIPYTYSFYAQQKTWERLRENRIYKKKWLVHPKVDFFNKIIVYTHLRI